MVSGCEAMPSLWIEHGSTTLGEMSVEQNLERNVDDVDDDKGELVRHTSIQEELAISFTRSPMQFVNVVFSYLLWLVPCFRKNRLTSQNVSVGNVNVFGGDSDDVQLCVNILHQILGSLSRCRAMTSIWTVSCLQLSILSRSLVVRLEKLTRLSE